MRESIFIAIVLILIYIFININNRNYKIIEYNGYKFLIQNTPSPQNNIKLLNEISNRLNILRNFFVENYKTLYDCKKCQECNNCNNCNKCYKGITHLLTKNEFYESIKLLEKNFNKKRTIFSENINDKRYTSYSINKGEHLVFCLKSRKTNKYHHINLLMYVGIHELAHCGCKEIGHTNLYNRIFKVYLLIGIQLNLYIYDNYFSNGQEYCGMTVNSQIISHNDLNTID